MSFSRFVLSGCTNLTGAGVTHLTTLVALEHLGLLECSKLTDVG
ncbi:hypothetical protein [Candidatus Protochlamydia amoebophila]|nr:hypothetical protein [Candidatus Protochlamydia amoebophila]